MGAVALTLLGAGLVHAQGLQMPRGLTVANQLEYAWFEDPERDPTLEDWMDVRYAYGGFSAGLRFVTFQPPDPTISTTDSHFDVNYKFVEAGSDLGSIRAGNYYALFGQGLALNSYEERDVRIDTSLEGIRVSGNTGNITVSFLSGNTVFGSSEDKERPRGDWLHAADGEISLGSGLMVGGSAVRLQRDGDSPQNMKVGRGSLTANLLSLLDVYAYGEYGELQRPGDDPMGRGLFGSVVAGLGPLNALAEIKSYDEFTMRNSGNVPYNLPPSLIREHTYTLLNRHPHPLDADDEIGFQGEATFTVNELRILGVGLGLNVLGYGGQTRNQDFEAEIIDEIDAGDTLSIGQVSELTNYWDELYAEVDLEFFDFFGIPNITLITAADYQKSFDTYLPGEDPFRELFTNIHELRVVADDTHSFRVQVEHQHNQSTAEGEFDTYFGLLEWSRSPDLTLNLVAETSNRAEEQHQSDEAIDGLYGIVSYHVSDNHDISVLYGRRLAGFVCVGGVCRLEPEFEGVEVRLLSRF